MKILIVCSGAKPVVNFKFSIHQAFIYEQIKEIKEQFGITFDILFIKKGGITGYLYALKEMRLKIKYKKYDLIHAYYGLSAFITIFQSNVSVLCTFLGSDINNRYLRKISHIVSIFSQHSIFVSRNNAELLNRKANYSIIPFGVDLQKYYPIEKNEARFSLKVEEDRIVIVVPSFSRHVKNFQLAKRAIEQLHGYKNIKLIELYNGYSFTEMNLLYNCADLFLMTSKSEGSPQTIKEAMACNCPIVSVDVGDVKDVIGVTQGCYITSYDHNDIADKINLVLKAKQRTNGRERITQYDNKIMAKKIFSIYQQVLNANM